MTFPFTFSEVDRVVACPASHAFPACDETNEYASVGSVAHAFLCAVNETGSVDAALESAPAEHRESLAALSLDGLPLNKMQWLAEPAYAWNWKHDFAVCLGTNIGRKYADTMCSNHAALLVDDRPLSANLLDWIPGALDVVGLTPNAVVVSDFKILGHNLPAAKDSGQLKTQALATARAYGKDTAIISYLRPGKDGEPPWYDRAELDALDLDAHAEMLADTARKVIGFRSAAFNGEIPPTSIGDHCRYCPALRTCPSQTALVRQMAGDQLSNELTQLVPLNVDTAGYAYQRVQQARLILNKIEDSIYAVARTTPVPIGDGKVLMETTTRRESVSGPVVRQLMTEQFGAAAAEEACEYSSTKTAIDGVIRKVAKERGTKITELKDSFYSDLAKANGINAKHYTSIRVQKARKELAS